MERNQRDQTARILVVDDEQGMREGCRRALTPLGFDLDSAGSVAAGLQLIEGRSYDLLLLDIMLPDGSGLNLVDQARERDPTATCIIITGFATIQMAVEAVRRGAFQLLSKPFTSDELIIAVQQGLEHRRLKAVEAEAQELARAKENLEELDAMKSRFMLQLTHELRAPVAAIQSYLNLIATGHIPEEEMEETLARTQARLEELLELIDDLMNLAHLKEVGGLPTGALDPQPAADILEAVCDLLDGQAQEKGQKLEIALSDRPNIVARREDLRQIWMNLISNAIKYTPPGGRIDVSLRTSGPELITTVEDTGIGIAEEDLPHIFAEFFRTGRAKATGEIGTGLGLSIVKHLVDAYQGGIQVQSKPGRGTRFTVRLPLQPARGGAAEEEDRESVPVSTNAASQPNPKAPYPPSFVLDGGLEARRQG